MEHLDCKSHELATKILSNSNELTLATIRKDGAPHASTVSFASNDLILYIAISTDSNKAHELSQDGRIGLTVNAPFVNWDQIQGMSMSGNATFVTDPTELALAGALLMRKLPAYAEIILEPGIRPWPGMLFVRIIPLTISLLDYTRGFGHTETFEVEENLLRVGLR